MGRSLCSSTWQAWGTTPDRKPGSGEAASAGARAEAAGSAGNGAGAGFRAAPRHAPAAPASAAPGRPAASCTAPGAPAGAQVCHSPAVWPWSGAGALHAAAAALSARRARVWAERGSTATAGRDAAERSSAWRPWRARRALQIWRRARGAARPGCVPFYRHCTAPAPGSPAAQQRGVAPKWGWKRAGWRRKRQWRQRLLLLLRGKGRQCWWQWARRCQQQRQGHLAVVDQRQRQ